MAARCGAWSPGARRRRSSTEAIGKLNFVLLPRKSSDPSKPVRLAPFESTGAGTIIAPTVRLSIEEIVARPRFIAVAWRWPGDVSVRAASARSALRERARLRGRRRFHQHASESTRLFGDESWKTPPISRACRVRISRKVASADGRSRWTRRSTTPFRSKLNAAVYRRRRVAAGQRRRGGGNPVRRKVRPQQLRP